jgi:acyl carrier protein
MSTAISKEQIQNWFIQKISTELEVPVDEIDVKASITDYGIDSITMVRLSAELSDFVGTEVEPKALYKYHTIDTISDFVHTLSTNS